MTATTSERLKDRLRHAETFLAAALRCVQEAHQLPDRDDQEQEGEDDG